MTSFSWLIWILNVVAIHSVFGGGSAILLQNFFVFALLETA